MIPWKGERFVKAKGEEDEILTFNYNACSCPTVIHVKGTPQPQQEAHSTV